MNFGLYVHIPFCLKKCDYCDFVSYTGRQDLHERYIDTLIWELEGLPESKVDTVYIGGGTPSSIDAHLIERLMRAVVQRFHIQQDAEVSIEVNPATVTAESLACYRACGINRISMGVQSFLDDELCDLGRLHDSHDVYESYRMIADSGFKNINLDLMFGINGQSRQSFASSLEQAISLFPAHISAYSLIVEENTPMYERKKTGTLMLPDEDTERAMYDDAAARLGQAGYRQYEISNFAREGFACRHNLKYWHCEPYYGIGVAAHSYDGLARWSNTTNLRSYLDCPKCGDAPTVERQVLTDADKRTEYIIMGLRLCEGISLQTFSEKFGEDFLTCYGDICEKYQKLGLLQVQEGRVFFTHDGFSVSNTILCELV